MNRCVLVVLSNPVQGMEQEYNDWYTHRHLADVLAVPGFISAQRFRLAQDAAQAAWKYLALYEFEADDPAVPMAALIERAGGPQMVLSQAMDMDSYSATAWMAITAKRDAIP